MALIAALAVGGCEGRTVGEDPDAATGGAAETTGSEGTDAAEASDEDAEDPLHGTTGADEAGTAGSSGGESGSEGSGGEMPMEGCSCVDLDLVCSESGSIDAYQCPLPAPCDVVVSMPVEREPLECALELLIAQEPARFEYALGYYDFEVDLYRGWFYILGPGEALDTECHLHGQDFGVSSDPQTNHHGIESPEYFEGCRILTNEAMLNCVLDGLIPADPAPLCKR